MKKLIIITLLLMTNIAWAQTASDIFETKNMTFYGLDFTKSRCIGVQEFPSAQDMAFDYFNKWNDMFLVGKNKIKIGAPYKKKNVEYENVVYQRNRGILLDELITDNPYHLKRSSIVDYMEEYADESKTGIGMIYIVEAINANEKYLSIWITFFNMKTGEVLITEPVRSKGKGRKFDDYWYNAFVKLYEGSADDYKAWKKTYK